MGDKGGKKDKNKAIKQKQQQVNKKNELQKTKLPAKNPAQCQLPIRSYWGECGHSHTGTC